MVEGEMTEYKKTWKIAEGGHTLGTIDIISPWTGEETEAVVDIDTGEVIAAHGATCTPFFLNVPPDILKKDKPESGTIGGIRYPGDDGSEPEDVREEKAQAYARSVEKKAGME
jgi:hypothetical protein